MVGVYKVIAPDGKEYGPVPDSTIQQWFAEGRITKDTMVFVTFRNQWARLGDVFDVARWSAPSSVSVPKPPMPLQTSISLLPDFPTHPDLPSHPKHSESNTESTLNSHDSFGVEGEMEDNSQNRESTKPKVRGWLLFLCVSLTILSPSLTLINLLNGYSAANQLSDKFPLLMTITHADSILSTILMTFSIYSGIALWRIKPGAARLTKIYLLIFLGYALIEPFLYAFAELPPQSNQVIIEEGIKGFFRGVVYVTIWFLYLSKSRRVKHTFGHSRSKTQKLNSSKTTSSTIPIMNWVIRISLVLVILIAVSVLEVWRHGIGRNPFTSTFPSIVGSFAVPVVIGLIASAFAKQENIWHVFLAVAYAALFLVIMGTINEFQSP